MKHLSWIVTIPVTVAVVVFALANRGDVTLQFWPFPWAATLPLFVVVLACLLVGFLLGALLAWLSAAPRRRRARQTAERARELQRQLTELQRRQSAAERSAPPANGMDNRPSGDHPAAGPAAPERLPGA